MSRQCSDDEARTCRLCRKNGRPGWRTHTTQECHGEEYLKERDALKQAQRREKRQRRKLRRLSVQPVQVGQITRNPGAVASSGQVKLKSPHMTATPSPNVPSVEKCHASVQTAATGPPSFFVKPAANLNGDLHGIVVVSMIEVLEVLKQERQALSGYKPVGTAERLMWLDNGVFGSGWYSWWVARELQAWYGQGMTFLDTARR